MIQNLVFNLVGGLGIFLFGMKSMSEALQGLAGDRLRRGIAAVTDNRLLGVGTGLLVTMIVQSSSVTTVMVVSFVNAGLMSLMQAASVILGANIGKTITGWILVLDLHESALPILGVGVFVHIVAKRESTKFLGQLAMGFGMVFFGLNLMKAGFSPLKELPQFTALMGIFGAAGFGNLVLGVLVGTVLTMVVQSSSAMLGVTIAMASVGLLTFEAAAALVLGENIGTTVTAQLAAINATADGRRAAMFHTLVNVLGVSVMLILFPFWISAVDAITPGDPLLTDPTGTRPNITAHIAVAHTSFNVIMVLIVLPFMKSILRLVNLLVSPLGKEHTSLKFLHTSMVGSPALAIEQGRQEVFQMADLTAEILHLTGDLYRDMTSTQSGIRDRILRKEKITDTIQHEITIFMSRVMAGVLTRAQTEEVRCLIRVADEIESVADYCERLANYRSRLLREGMSLTGAGLKDIQEYLRVTIAFYEEVIDRAKRGETGWLLAIQTKQGRLAEVANDLRDSHLHRLATQECQPTAGIFFNDMLMAMRRIRNHSYNIAEAFLGQK